MIFTGKIIPAPYRWLTAALFFILLSGQVQAYTGNSPVELYIRGVELYQQSRYDEAKPPLEKAVTLAPEISSYHHWLGKVYGRLAENAGLFRAISLSRRTLEHLETAVRLDSGNVDALKDLMQYYRQAPGFLGGSREKAEKLEKRVELLESADVSRQDKPRISMDSPS